MRFYVVLVFFPTIWVLFCAQTAPYQCANGGFWGGVRSLLLVLLSASAARKQRQELGKTSSHDVEGHEANGHGDDDRKQDE